MFMIMIVTCVMIVIMENKGTSKSTLGPQINPRDGP